MIQTNPFQEQTQNNDTITTTNDFRAISNWDLSPVKANPRCVRLFFELLEMKGISLTEYAKRRGTNRSKLSQILHGLDVPKTPEKRKFWAEEIIGFDVQMFWLPDIDEINQKTKEESVSSIDKTDLNNSNKFKEKSNDN